MKTLIKTMDGKAFESKELVLTSKGLSFVNWDCPDDDIDLVFGSDNSCRVHSVLAEFLSPKIARIRRNDPLLNVYTFKNDSSELFGALESLISSLRSGGTFRVDKSNFAVFLQLSHELENHELLSSLLELIKTENLPLHEAIVLFRGGIDLGSAFTNRFVNLRDFIASRFYEIGKELLQDLDLETVRLLLSSPSLKIEDEDSLYDFIRSRSGNDLSFTTLFEFVYFEYLSVNRIEDFASFVSENLLENISSGIWTRICGRLILETKLKNNPRASKDEDATAESKNVFVYDGSKPLDGIIAHLTREYGGSVHDHGIVNVTASSVVSSAFPKNATDLETRSFFISKPNSNSWICYDFKERRVLPTSYSVKSYDCGPGGWNLKSWVLEVSQNGSDWTVVDSRNDNHDLDDSLVTRNFTISQSPKEAVQFIRLHQLANQNGNHQLCIAALEIFGTLSSN